MALNFNDVANKKLEDIEEVPLQPVGTYRLSIPKLPTINETENWDIVNFNCRIMEALDDVDPSDYKGDLVGSFLQKSFLFNKNDEAAFIATENQLRNFLENHLKCAEPTDSIKEAMNKAVGQEFLGVCAWRADNRPGNEGKFQAGVSRTAPLD